MITGVNFCFAALKVYIYKMNICSRMHHQLRTHMSCKAAILMLFNFTSARQGEEVAAARDLRCQLIDILVNIAPTTSELTQPGDHQETEEISADFAQPPHAPLLGPATPIVISNIPDPPPSTPLLEPATPVNSVLSPPHHTPLLEPATPVNSLHDPPPPMPLLEPQTPVNSVPEPTNPLPMSTPILARPLETSTSSTKSKCVPTEYLLSCQQTMRNKQDRGRKFTSREVVRRLNLQKGELTKLAKNVHHGSKNDFIASLAESVTCEKEHDSDVDSNWDGILSPQDGVNLAKRAHDPKTRESIYDIIVEEDAAIHHHLSAIEVLDLQDTTNPTETMHALRRKLPGFFDSERKINTLKAKFRKEFEVVWQPERTHAGWRINPDRLRETLLHLYWGLPPSEWWKIYGDGRNFGGKDSVAVTLNVLNNEAMFHGVSYHSPDEY